MATWKKILREDYAVGDTLGLIRFDSATASNTITFRLWDNSNSGSVPTVEGTGVETLDLTFGAGNFSVSGTTVNITPLQIQNGGTDAFQLYDGTNYDLNFSSSDSSLTIDTTTAGTVDIKASTSTIFGNLDGSDGDTDPDSVTYNLGDTIIFTSSDSGIEIGPAVETNGIISLDFNVAHTTLTGTLDSSTNNYQAGTDAITFATYTTDAIGVASSVTGTTVSLGVLKEDIQDVVGAMVSSNTEYGITVTYQDSDGTLDFALGNLNFTGNTGAGAAIDYSVGSTLTVVGAADSGITVNAAGTTLTIDQTDYTIAGTTGTASKTPVNGLTFSSGDSSVTSTITGGEGAAVNVNLQATPKVTTDLAGTTTYYLLLQNGGSTTDGETVNLAAYIDTGDTGNVGPQYTPSTGTLRVPNLVVDGTSTQLNVETVTAQDPLIVINSDGDALASNQGGIQLNTGASTSAHMVYNSANSNLTGWQVSKSGASQDLHTVAVMDHASGAPAGNGAGPGTFYYDTAAKILYVDVA